jgi:hypothetical protein
MDAPLNEGDVGRNMIAGTWIDASLIGPPKDGSSYLLMARVDNPGERRWPIVGHWDSIEGWRSSAAEFGLKLLDITYWMAIPEIPNGGHLRGH